jgi:hypothetical protein
MKTNHTRLAGAVLSTMVLVACQPTQASDSTRTSANGPTAPLIQSLQVMEDEALSANSSGSAPTEQDGSLDSFKPIPSRDSCVDGQSSESLREETVKAVSPARRNILGTSLTTCSLEPLTGWYRDGFCRTDERDRGVHVVCAVVDETFLDFTKKRGNDLSTPRRGFPGLKSGDRWCLCAARWYEAQREGKAPSIILSASHTKALTIVPKDVLQAHRYQPNSK